MQTYRKLIIFEDKNINVELTLNPEDQLNDYESCSESSSESNNKNTFFLLRPMIHNFEASTRPNNIESPVSQKAYPGPRKFSFAMKRQERERKKRREKTSGQCGRCESTSRDGLTSKQ